MTSRFSPVLVPAQQKHGIDILFIAIDARLLRIQNWFSGHLASSQRPYAAKKLMVFVTASMTWLTS
jgi:hypothetical protein